MRRSNTKSYGRNEARYGAEVRAKYGDGQADAANAAVLAMTEADYERFEALKDEVQRALEDAVRAGDDPKGPSGERIVRLHKNPAGHDVEGTIPRRRTARWPRVTRRTNDSPPITTASWPAAHSSCATRYSIGRGEDKKGVGAALPPLRLSCR